MQTLSRKQEMQIINLKVKMATFPLLIVRFFSKSIGFKLI